MHPSALILGLATTALSAPTAPRPAAAPQQQQKRALSVPLHRRSAIVPDSHLPPHKRSVKLDAAGLDEALERIGREAERVRGKYGRTLASAKKGKRASADVALYDADQDLEYFITMQIGTPAQSLNVTVDTGSADLWVPSQDCSQGCASNTTFYDTSSSSLTQTRDSVTVEYGSGEVAGDLAYETVSLGDGLSVNKTGFIVASEIQSLLQSDVPVSGLMGFGWASIAESGATPYWQQVLVNGTSASSFDQPAFSMSLARAPGDRTGQQVYGEVDSGGSFVLGGWDESAIDGGIGAVEWNNLTKEGYWEIPIASATVNGAATSLDSQTAAIDSGTTLIAVPSASIQALYDGIDGAQEIQGGNGLWAYPQSSAADVSLTFSGKAWSINSDDFCYYSTQATVNGKSGEYCVGAFFDGGTNLGESQVPDWIVGDSYLKNVYTIYRASPASVGFGALSSNSSTSSGGSTGGALALAASSSTVLAAAAAAGAWMML